MTGCVPPSSMKYFYGRISRDDAENILKDRGAQEGLHLLRESMTCAGNYALSICYQGKIHHYSIEQQPDGMVMIQDGKKFKGPVELVNHHERTLDGFLTKPSIPCERPPDVAPMAWPGVTMLELERALYDKVTSMDLKGAKLQAALGPQRQKFIALVAKELHKEQPWFHDKISRDEADVRMNADGHADGKYLVRLRDDKSYALSLSIKSQTKHYKVDIHKSSSGDKLAIEDGPRFDNLMDMIAHYHNKTDGLLCKLSCPCVRPKYKKAKTVSGEKSRIYGTAAFLDDEERLNEIVDPLLNDPVVRQEGIVGNRHIRDAVWDDPDNDIPDDNVRFLNGKGSRSGSPHISVPAPAAPRPSSGGSDDDNQKVYDSVPRTEDVFNLNRADLGLMERLGAGNFGSVMRGVYKRKGQTIPVAIKTLKQDDIHNAESLLMDEAKVMAGLQHRNIVRLIGVCRSDTIMLVMELAQLGPLNKFLKKHHDLSSRIVIELMFQVAEGMAYLESKNFVHRDLAARNVLLVNERFAKISDFGMSKALGLGNNYYQAETAGKWPLKWYAPECIYYFKFDSRSDVWSYGVTLWEALSYGAKPYKGLKGQQILALIEHGERLDKPARCPQGVYSVMLGCWNYDKLKRPSFKEIVESLRRYK